LVRGEIDTVRAFQWMLENWGYRVNDLAYTLGEALVKAMLKLSPESILVS